MHILDVIVHPLANHSPNAAYATKILIPTTIPLRNVETLASYLQEQHMEDISYISVHTHNTDHYQILIVSPTNPKTPPLTKTIQPLGIQP